MAFTGPLWLLPVHYGFYQFIMALKAIIGPAKHFGAK
jgi:hypothetical protein